MSAETTTARILVVGATGFVGRALMPLLPSARAASRHGPFMLDVSDEASVRRSLEGIDVAYWLVHGLRRGGDYPAWEREVAARFGVVCRERGVQRIVYLGGIEPRGAAHDASTSTKHLASRHETGRALASSGVDVVELRAGMIVGAGSESWTIARDACARLPVFLAPPWLSSKQQPIAIDDVAAALVRSLTLPAGIYDVPGPETLTGREIVARTARHLDRHALTVPIPIFPRSLAGRIAPFVTRANGDVAKELFLGMGLDLTVDGDGVFSHMPDHRRVSFDDAVVRALAADDVSFAGRLVEAMLKRGPKRRRRRG
jgi:uncharacterized protein YbjT (DUF2867 family)